jgi:hypothetical protein
MAGKLAESLMIQYSYCHEATLAEKGQEEEDGGNLLSPWLGV